MNRNKRRGGGDGESVCTEDVWALFQKVFVVRIIF